MLTAFVLPQQDVVLSEELRQPAALPAWPTDRASWLALPAKIDAFLQDHYGLRRFMTFARAIVVHLLLNTGNESVLLGENGRMFYRGDDLVQQSAGLIVRLPLLVETADTIARVQAALAERGIAFLYAPAPNSATIETAALPGWAARQPGRPTEYDVVMDLLRARRVRAIDLRPALAAALTQGDVYLEHDSHWNPRGALVGFNQIVAGGGHPDWELDPATALTPPFPLVGGDLARMLGVATLVSSLEPLSALPVYPMETFPAQPEATSRASSDHGGPTILVIGDSFTEYSFAPMVLVHAGQIAWTHHVNCAFDWNWIERFHPDEVWWIPTERYIPCLGGSPAHMPANAATARSG
jgi:hypothetical protein